MISSRGPARCTKVALLVAAIWTASVGFAAAQLASTDTREVGRLTTTATRIDSSEAPIIDADLSDPAWASATVISDFTQIEPLVGAPATERREL